MSDENDDCPICGQPYVHERVEEKALEPVVRNDAKLCKSRKLGGRRKVYIHFPDKQEEYEKEVTLPIIA